MTEIKGNARVYKDDMEELVKYYYLFDLDKLKGVAFDIELWDGTHKKVSVGRVYNAIESQSKLE